MEGMSRIFVSYFGTLVLVHPEQLRRASQDEKHIAQIEADAVDAYGDAATRGEFLRGSRQFGFIDEREAQPEPERHELPTTTTPRPGASSSSGLQGKDQFPTTNADDANETTAGPATAPPAPEKEKKRKANKPNDETTAKKPTFDNLKYKEPRRRHEEEGRPATRTTGDRRRTGSGTR